MFYQTMLRPGQPDGMLVPIPQYPLYSALTTLFGGHLVGYYLDESASWEARVGELERALKEARAKGTNVRGLVVINPGNPTGQCLDLKAQQEIVAFAVRENLVLFADEVYQENIIAEGK
jgi:aspartate/methionine/tyrosine aminotransferase